MNNELRGRGLKLNNEYKKAYPAYEKTPKAVIAAVALSLAIRLTAINDIESFENAQAMVTEEWQALHKAGIVPQKPR